MFTLLKKKDLSSHCCFHMCKSLPDGGGLDGGSGEGGVKIFCPGERWNHRHIPDVKPSINKEEVSKIEYQE